MSLRSVNLNLVPILRALFRERNLSRAAVSLGLTQPAVSGALGRLRKILNDPLLVRDGRGMKLTLRAIELIEPVERICTALEDVLGSEEFDPFTCQRRFVIAGADYVVVTIGPNLVRAIARLAPNASLHFVDLPHSELEPNAGEIDLFIVPELLFADSRQPSFRHCSLIDDEFVTVVGAGHPLATVEKPSEAQLLAEPYVVHYPALIAAGEAMAQNWPAGRAVGGRRVIAQIQQYSLLPALAIEASCAAFMPRRIAHYMEQFTPIRIIEDAQPVAIQLALAWHRRDEHDPALRWIRQLVIDARPAPGPTHQPDGRSERRQSHPSA